MKITDWSNERRKTLEEQVREEIEDIVTHAAAGVEAELESRLRSLIPYNVPVIIYNEDREVVYERKGTGMGGARRMRYKRSQQDTDLNQFLTPVQENEGMVWYYRIGPVHFGLESANAQFLESMRRTIWISVVCSFILAFLFAIFISKNMVELLRIETLINDLGELTRLESPEMKIHPVNIDTAIFFKELNNRFIHEIEKKGLSVLRHYVKEDFDHYSDNGAGCFTAFW